ncbi:MAG: hypothetical protein HGA71_01780 [Azonexaceae bacterium]|nr:hypothetical protein [Azonexaceae bacterium]
MSYRRCQAETGAGNLQRRIAYILVAGLLMLGLAACQRISAGNFVGKWQSSRAVTPIYLAANGEWEIRQDDGTILQYGVWRYADKKIIWSIKQGDRIIDDPTPVIAVDRTEFRLQERDGATSIFRRLD